MRGGEQIAKTVGNEARFVAEPAGGRDFDGRSECSAALGRTKLCNDQHRKYNAQRAQGATG